MKEKFPRNEVDNQHDFLFPTPEAGVVVKGLDISDLNNNPFVKIKDAEAHQKRSFGASIAFSYIPDADESYKEFWLLDESNRPISIYSTGNHELTTMSFSYDTLGRLVRKNRGNKSELYIYKSDEPDNDGNFSYLKDYH